MEGIKRMQNRSWRTCNRLHATMLKAPSPERSRHVNSQPTFCRSHGLRHGLLHRRRGHRCRHLLPRRRHQGGVEVDANFIQHLQRCGNAQATRARAMLRALLVQLCNDCCCASHAHNIQGRHQIWHSIACK